MCSFRKYGFAAIIILSVLLSTIFVTKFTKETHPVLQSQDEIPVKGVTDFTPGDQRGAIVVDDRERTYLLHIPHTTTTSTPLPLVLVFHGGGFANVEQLARMTRFSEYADKEEFIVVYPEGLEHNWSDGRGTTDSELLGVDDVKFIRELVGTLSRNLPIDQRRIYATGMSNGASMVYRLACEASDVFAAIGPVVNTIATNLVETCVPPSPVALVAIQGAADPFHDIYGVNLNGLGDGGEVESAQATMELWMKINGCSPEAVTEDLSVKVADGTTVSRTTYASCHAGTAIEYYIVDGMGHAWPPADPILKRISGETSHNIDATETIWRFFAQHPKE